MSPPPLSSTLKLAAAVILLSTAALFIGLTAGRSGDGIGSGWSNVALPG